METKAPYIVRKKPGPTPGPQTNRTNVMLDPDLIEWGKEQPGGLSETVRRLLRREKELASAPKGNGVGSTE